MGCFASKGVSDEPKGLSDESKGKVTFGVEVCDLQCGKHCYPVNSSYVCFLPGMVVFRGICRIMAIYFEVRGRERSCLDAKYTTISCDGRVKVAFVGISFPSPEVFESPDWECIGLPIEDIIADVFHRWHIANVEYAWRYPDKTVYVLSEDSFALLLKLRSRVVHEPHLRRILSKVKFVQCSRVARVDAC